jgi:hypothetical protein
MAYLVVLTGLSLADVEQKVDNMVNLPVSHCAARSAFIDKVERNCHLLVPG